MDGIDERIIILILFVVISGVKWVMKKIKGEEDDQQYEDEESGSLENIYEKFREEIRHRQTTTEQPAPPQTQAQTQAPPPLPQEPPPQAAPQPTQPYVPKKVTQPKLSKEEKAALKRVQTQSTQKRRHRSGTPSSISDLLASPHSTRQAIILHEILGKPKSMQQG